MEYFYRCGQRIDWSEEEQEDSNDGGTIRKGRIFK